MPDVPRWLAVTWLSAGLVGLAASLAVAAFGSVFAATTTASALEALTVTEGLLVTVGETADAIDETLVGVEGGLETVQGSVGDAAVTLTQVARVADEMGEVATETIPESLDRLGETMPQLISTAGVVDGAMRALRFVGVDYDPSEPLDDALRELDSQLAGIPAELRGQAEAFDEASDGVADFGYDALTIAEDVGVIQERMESSRQVIAGYTEAAEGALAVISGLQDRLEFQAAAARVTVLVLGIAIAVGQTVPIAFGWWALRSASPRRGVTLQPPDKPPS